MLCPNKFPAKTDEPPVDGFPKIEDDGADVVVVAPKLSPSKNEPLLSKADDTTGLVTSVAAEAGIEVAAGGDGAGVTGSIVTAAGGGVMVGAIGEVAAAVGKEASEIAATAWNRLPPLPSPVTAGDAVFDDKMPDNND